MNTEIYKESALTPEKMHIILTIKTQIVERKINEKKKLKRKKRIQIERKALI